MPIKPLLRFCFLTALPFCTLSACHDQTSPEMEAVKQECAAKGMNWKYAGFDLPFHGFERIVCVPKG